MSMGMMIFAADGMCSLYNLFHMPSLTSLFFSSISVLRRIPLLRILYLLYLRAKVTLSAFR